MKVSNIILIKDLIADAKTEDAIIEFEKLVLDKDIDASNTLILLKSRVNRLKNEHLKGIIERGDFHRGIFQVESSVLDLINEFIEKNKNVNNSRIEKETVPDPIGRQEKIGYFAKKLYSKGDYGILRQKAVLSSFAMPNRDPTDSIWRLRDEVKPRGKQHFESSYSERKWLEKHVGETYAKLIIQPHIAVSIAQRRGKNAGLLRLKCLLEYLQSNLDKIDVVISDDAKKENIIIIGDWFFTYSASPTDYGFENTTFEWRKEIVQSQTEIFDNEFDRILKIKGLDVYDAKREVVKKLKELIAEISAY